MTYPCGCPDDEVLENRCVNCGLKVEGSRHQCEGLPIGVSYPAVEIRRIQQYLIKKIKGLTWG